MVGTPVLLWLREAFGSITSFSIVRTDCSATTGDFLIEYDRDAQPCAAANPAITLRLQSERLVGWVAELGSLAVSVCPSHASELL